jgi:cyclopropane-fatty-acyl-phospholipid synthase
MSAPVSSGSPVRLRPEEERVASFRRDFGVETTIHRVAGAVSPDTPPPRPARAPERWLVSRLLDAVGNPPFGIVLWDGMEIRGGEGPIVASVIIHDRPTLLRLIANPELHFGDAYSAGRVKVEGDLVKLLEAVYRASEAREKPKGRLRTAVERWRRRARSNTLAGSRNNIHHHYDIGDDFYKLWLDRELVYTCAYFPTPDCTLEEAQAAKMDLVCRKLWLQPGETVVEAGCGWGALALFMARHYGVKVKAYNVSREQIKHAQARARAEGLDSRVEFIEDDYRTIQGPFDVFVSIGMLEHVGPDHYHALGAVIDRCLSPTGRGLLHSIGRDRPGPVNTWIEQRIFPGAYPPSLQEMLEVLGQRAFSVLDVENLRLHYALTLKHWLDRFEAAAGCVAKMFDERFVRAWRLYLAGSQAGFNAGSLQLFQLLFARHAVNDIPWTRQRLWRPEQATRDSMQAGEVEKRILRIDMQ